MYKPVQTTRQQHAHDCFKTVNRQDVNVSHTPCANLVENAEEYVISLAAPGVLREDFELNIDSNTISIEAREASLTLACSAHKKIQLEYDFSTWKRSFVLPSNADTSFAHAFYLNGELEVHIPKNRKPLKQGLIKVEVY